MACCIVLLVEFTFAAAFTKAHIPALWMIRVWHVTVAFEIGVNVGIAAAADVYAHCMIPV